MNDSDNEPLRDVTNFKKVQTSKKRKTKYEGAQYGDVCPQFEPSLQKYTWLPVVSNGSRCEPVKAKECIRVLSNTCPFDSLFEIICMVVANNSSYAKQVEEMDSDIFSCAKLVIKEKLGAAFYKERARILRKLNCTTKDIKKYKRNSDKSMYNIVKINSLCNLSERAVELFSTTPSYVTTYTCQLCNSSKTENFIEAHIDLQIIKDCGIKNLSRSLELRPKKEKKCCMNIMDVNTHYGPHLLINVEIGESNQLSIFNIPRFVEVAKNIKYKIVGFVGYQGEYIPTLPGHYVGYSYVELHWLKYDDLASSKSPESVSSNSIVDPQILLYLKVTV